MLVTVSSKFMGPQTIDRRGGTNHSPPPASGDSDDRIDMALLNFEKDPADVRAALPRELMRRTICCAGDFGDTASSPGLNLVSTLSRCCGFRRKNDGHDNLNRDFRVLIVPGVRGVSVAARVLPLPAALCKGVSPSLSRCASRSAPPSAKARSALAWPAWAARCAAVMPNLCVAALDVLTPLHDLLVSYKAAS